MTQVSDVVRLALVVEDEPPIAALIRMYLERAGFAVQVATNGRAGLEAARSQQPDVIVLDVRLPEVDGLSVCRVLRAEDNWTPVLFVTARDEEMDRIQGLELGADDYVTKPFSPGELVARVEAVLRRHRRTAQTEVMDPSLVVGRVRLDPEGYRVWADGQEVRLTSTEFELLAQLMRRPGRVHDRDELLRQVWGYDGSAGNRTVDVHVAQLRSKLGDASPIRTVRGVGYAAEDR